jgi:hypothetical protein
MACFFLRAFVIGFGHHGLCLFIVCYPRSIVLAALCFLVDTTERRMRMHYFKGFELSVMCMPSNLRGVGVM